MEIRENTGLVEKTFTATTYFQPDILRTLWR